jgi:capsid protein
MTLWNAAGNHPLLSEWYESWIGWDEMAWASESRVIASRAQSLACNDPFIAAVVLAHVNGRVGPTGLRFSSLFDDAPDVANTTDRSRTIRRQINAISNRTWAGNAIDAEGVRTRNELERSLAWSAFVLGDGFAVRVWQGSHSVWRLIQPDRIRTPAKAQPGYTVRDGGAFKDGALVGIYVDSGRLSESGYWIPGESTLVPWTAADGTPNVIHATGYRLPGMWRGISRLAPCIIMQRQLGGVLESHVAGKRLQSILGLIVGAEDPADWKAAQDAGNAVWPGHMKVTGPMNVWVKPPGSDIQFTQPAFNGADLDAYLKTVYKTQCSSLQMPVDVVLCQMGEASLSSARAGLDQWDRTCQVEQEAHIAQVSEPLDRVAITDAVAVGTLTLSRDELASASAGQYSRPPKYSTDRLKDANTIKTLSEAGVSKSTAFAMFGFNWEDEQERVRAESEFVAAQGMVPQTEDPPPAPAAQESPIPATPQGSVLDRIKSAFRKVAA